eukprot:10860981-Heterocapsa_arctica.AAC.1
MVIASMPEDPSKTFKNRQQTSKPYTPFFVRTLMAMARGLPDGLQTYIFAFDFDFRCRFR